MLIIGDYDNLTVINDLIYALMSIEWQDLIFIEKNVLKINKRKP